jgi:hypothetical protein
VTVSGACSAAEEAFGRREAFVDRSADVGKEA